MLASLTAPRSLLPRCAGPTPSCRGTLLRSLISLNVLAAAVRGELLDLLAPAAAADLPSRRRQASFAPPRPPTCPAPRPSHAHWAQCHTCRDGSFRCDATPEQLMAAGAHSLLFGRTLTTAAAARPVPHLIQRGSTAAASLGARQAPQPWATGAWGAAAARRAPTCPAPTAAMSSSSGSGSASAMAAAASPSAALASSTIIDAEPPASSAASTATGASSGSGAGLATLEDLQFDNTFTRELPAGGRGVTWVGCGLCRCTLRLLYAAAAMLCVSAACATAAGGVAWEGCMLLLLLWP